MSTLKKVYKYMVFNDFVTLGPVPHSLYALVLSPTKC